MDMDKGTSSRMVLISGIESWRRTMDPEMDGRLGHNGARPYLSPMADYRRGEDHEMPANQANRPVGRDGRPRREMHAAKCILWYYKSPLRTNWQTD